MENKGVNAQITYDGLIGGIKLNGIDLSQSVTTITYRHEAGQLPTLILELNPEHADLKAVVGSVLLKEKTSPAEATAEEVAEIISEKLQNQLSSSRIPESW